MQSHTLEESICASGAGSTTLVLIHLALVIDGTLCDNLRNQLDFSELQQS